MPTKTSAALPQDFGHPHLLEDYTPVPQPTITTKICAVCHASAPHTLCSKCRNIRYCSTSCQELDWKLHKVVCKHYIEATAQTRCPSSRRVLYFHPLASKPTFTDIPFGPDGTVYGLSEHLFPGVPDADIKRLSFHDRFLPYFIQLAYDTNPDKKRELEENRSLGRPFRGPVVALAYDAETGLSAPALDVDTTIMRPLMQYVELRREYDGPIFVEQPQKRYTKGEWKAIMGDDAGCV
ncbi:hypothetical protein BDW02DRAFT_502684 [Decorospora gaudefroyi]|uniref:MYND-type domain-containing protein n=1 Tax=Decorospora gaudefroyi TaxID=184978 RepID=A0A6A5K4I5_9PLEO|nr:hypothetical protein BDW02DRAFT_502684 [Decorospora gaudefroyi]